MRIIKLRPAIGQTFVESMKAISLFVIGVIASGTDSQTISVIGITICLLAFLSILIRLWYLSSLSWTVTDNQIISKEGIFTKTTDYMELYRVIDYQERQGFIQGIIGLRDIIIISGDKSHPQLVIKGIKGNKDIINIINENVEKSKERRNIYEITNR